MMQIYKNVEQCNIITDVSPLCNVKELCLLNCKNISKESIKKLVNVKVKPLFMNSF